MACFVRAVDWGKKSVGSNWRKEEEIQSYLKEAPSLWFHLQAAVQVMACQEHGISELKARANTCKCDFPLQVEWC